MTAPACQLVQPARLCALPVHQRTAAEGVLRKVQEQPEAWTRVDRILELSKNQQTKFFALQARLHACGACMATLLPMHQPTANALVCAGAQQKGQRYL